MNANNEDDVNNRCKQSTDFMPKNKVSYFLFSKTNGLIEQEIELDIGLSEQQKKENKRKTGRCFYNSSLTANHLWDYVEGFALTEHGFYAHGWNRKTDNASMIDVTLDTPILQRMCQFGNSYIEVFRYSFEDIGQCISKTQGKTPFFMDLSSEEFYISKERVKVLYPNIPYLGEDSFYHKIRKRC